MTSHMHRLIPLMTLAIFAGAMLRSAHAQEPESRAEEQARRQEVKARI